jgi:hypothetical protein
MNFGPLPPRRIFTPFMRKPALLIFFNLILIVTGLAQGKKALDSLNHIVHTSRSDKARIRAYGELAIINRTENKTALAYCDSAWRIASVTQEERTGMLCYTACIYAGLYRSYSDTVNYGKKIEEATRFANQAGEEKFMALVYHQQALYAYYANDHKLALELFLKSMDLLENTEYQDICVIQYYILTSIFERLADYDACLRYAKKALKHATYIDNICRSNHDLANAYMQLAKSDPVRNKPYIDSCLTILYKIRHTLEKKRDEIRQPILPMLVYNDLANVYMHIESKFDDDSARYYLNLTRHEALAIHHNSGYAAMSVMLASYALDDNNVAGAAILMNEAEKAYKEAEIPDLIVDANISMGFAKLNEKRGFFKEALENHRRFFLLKDSIYRIESLEAVKRAEAQFVQEKKERQIALLKEEEAGRRQKLYFSIGVAFVTLAALLMLYRSTHFKNKFYNEKEKLLARQAETSRLQKDDAEHALRLQKKASERLALEHQFEVSQRDQYQRELTTGVQSLESKNELLLKLKSTLARVPSGKEGGDKQATVTEMLGLIDENLESGNDFDRFSRNFEYVYPNFFKKLEARSVDNLSQLDLRYCAYIYMGLSTKEMSNLLNIEPASIRTARYRLKQKFDLGKEEDLLALINNAYLPEKNDRAI